MNKKIGRRNKSPEKTICGKVYNKRTAIQGRIELGHEYFAILDKTVGTFDVKGEVDNLIKEVRQGLTQEQLETEKLHEEISEIRKAENVEQPEATNIGKLRAKVNDLNKAKSVVIKTNKNKQSGQGKQ